MNIAEASIKKSTITGVFVFLLAIGGLIAYNDMGKLEYPEFTIKQALVTTQYVGATPKEVEEEVTEVLESAIQQLGEVKEITSTTSAGLSIIMVEIKDKYKQRSLQQIWDKLRRKVSDATSSLPAGASAPVVNDDFGDVYGVIYALTGDDSFTYADMEEVAKDLRRQLLTVEDVARVRIDGAQTETIYIEMSKAKLKQFGILISSVLSVLQNQNSVESAGSVRSNGKYVVIQPTGSIKSVKELEDLVISGATAGERIYLKDIATVKRGYYDPANFYMRYDGKKALGIGISTASGGNVVTMGEAVTKRLDEISYLLPVGMQLDVIYNQSQQVIDAMDGFLLNLLESFIIVVVLLMIFVGLRSGALIGLILLLTVSGTLMIMLMFDIEFQRVSLAALIIALGMLVDNAIVVTEGILVRIQQGWGKIEAATSTVAQTFWPLLGATFVAVLAFAPLGLSNNSAGEMLSSLFYVLLFSLLLSWILSITITPWFCSLAFKKRSADQIIDPYGGFIFRMYRSFLGASVRMKWLSALIMFGILFASMYCYRFVDQSFFPGGTDPKVLVDIWLPQGADINETAEIAQRLEKELSSYEEIVHQTTYVGRGGMRFTLSYSAEYMNSSYAQIIGETQNTEMLPALVEELNKSLPEKFPQARLKLSRIALGPSIHGKVCARFTGEDVSVLKELSDKALMIYRTHPDTTDVHCDWRQVTSVVAPQVNDIRARQAGVTRADIADALKLSMNGKVVGVYREDEKQIPIMLRLPEEERGKLSTSREMFVYSSSTGKAVPMMQVVDSFAVEKENPLILRRDRERTVSALCDPITMSPIALFQELRADIEAIPLPKGYSLEWGGEYEHSIRANKSLLGNFPYALLCMFLIILMMFNSIRKPIIIFICICFAVVGVTVGLILLNGSMDFMGVLGFISLSGMFVKNAIVLVDQIDIELAENKTQYRAILDSAVSRMRPVLMASLTTVLGMTPLLFDSMFKNLAIVIIFGLSFGVLITLLALPVLYAVFFRVKKGQDEPK